MPQQAALYRRLTVEENLRLFARMEEAPDVEEIVERMLDQTGLADRRHDQVSSLSGGNQQRINIAIGLLGDPSVLLLDEPSSGLDPSQRVRLWEFVAGLAKAGTTVIYSTHQIEEASHYGDRLVVLADGESIFDGTLAQMRRAAGARAQGPAADRRERLRPLPSAAGPLMRWLLVKDLQLLRRSPLVTGLLVIYPIVLAVLIGLAISRSPEKPRVAFLNQIPAGTGLQLGDRRLQPERGAPPALREDRLRRRLQPRRGRAEGQGRRRPRRPDPAAGLHQQAAGRAQHQLERAGDRRRDRQQRRSAQGAGRRRPDPLAAHPGQPAALGEDQRRRRELRADPRRRRVLRDPLPQPDGPHPRAAEGSSRSSTRSRRACRRRSARRWRR